MLIGIRLAMLTNGIGAIPDAGFPTLLSGPQISRVTPQLLLIVTAADG